MFDLQVVAFQADLTRVTTLMMGREGQPPDLSGDRRPRLPPPAHPSPRQPGVRGQGRAINTYHVDLFAHFVAKLESTPDGDGTLLDHSMVVYGSAISDGDRHTHEDLPVLLVGRGDGDVAAAATTVPKDTPITNLFLTLLDHMGVEGEVTGRQHLLGCRCRRTATARSMVGGRDLKARAEPQSIFWKKWSRGGPAAKPSWELVVRIAEQRLLDPVLGLRGATAEGRVMALADRPGRPGPWAGRSRGSTEGDDVDNAPWPRSGPSSARGAPSPPGGYPRGAGPSPSGSPGGRWSKECLGIV